MREEETGRWGQRMDTWELAYSADQGSRKRMR